MIRTARTPPSGLAEAWWPLDAVRPSHSAWYDDHLESGWWDAGDLPRTRLRHAKMLADELLASLPQDVAAGHVRMLEYGCGPGTGLQELARRTNWELHGWDPSPDARAAARAIALEARIAEAETPVLETEDGAIDVLWAPRCFAAGDLDWSACLEEAHRVLRPGGMLAAVLAGPGAWRWEEELGAWDEATTGLLGVGFDRPAEEGGPVWFSSRWWLEEHWGRGFDLVLMRPAGLGMPHPDTGFGLAVWRRRAGDPLTAREFAAVGPGDDREGRAWQRQLVMAAAEARDHAARSAAALAGAEARAAMLERPEAVHEHPRVRHAAAAVVAMEDLLARTRAEGDR